MATKKLRTSAGVDTYTSINDWTNYLQATYTAGNPMVADEILLVQAGQIFSNATTFFCLKMGPNKVINFGGKKIIIKTDPADSIATLGPGTFIMGTMLFVSDDASIGNSSIEFRNIIWSIDGATSYFGCSTGFSTTFLAENTIFLARAQSNRIGFTDSSPITGTARSFKINQSTIFLFHQVGNPSGYNEFFNGGSMSLFNNAIDTFQINNSIFFSHDYVTPNTNGLRIGGTMGVHKSNTYQSYTSTPSVLSATGTISGSNGGNIGFGTQFLVGGIETAESVAAAILPNALDVQNYGSLSYIINTADAGTKAAVDILGRPRASDRGPYEHQEAPVLCWNYRARYKDSSRLWTSNGPGKYPSELKVPASVDISSGVMMDEGKLISPDRFRVIQ